MSVPVTLGDLKKAEYERSFFLAYLHNYASIVRHGMTEICMAIQMGRNMFLRVRHAPISRSGTPESTKIYGTLTMRKRLTWSDQIWYDNTSGRSVFLAIHSPHPTGQDPSAPIFWTSYMRANSMKNNNQILHGDQTRYDFTGSTTKF